MGAKCKASKGKGGKPGGGEKAPKAPEQDAQVRAAMRSSTPARVGRACSERSAARPGRAPRSLRILSARFIHCRRPRRA